MESKDNQQRNNINESEQDRSSMSQDKVESPKDYISGDSTPSSSGHQFPWIAMDPKHESKKSAQKTNL